MGFWGVRLSSVPLTEKRFAPPRIVRGLKGVQEKSINPVFTLLL